MNTNMYFYLKLFYFLGGSDPGWNHENSSGYVFVVTLISWYFQYTSESHFRKISFH